jgi:uncharacterized protein YkwD
VAAVALAATFVAAIAVTAIITSLAGAQPVEAVEVVALPPGKGHDVDQTAPQVISAGGRAATVEPSQPRSPQRPAPAAEQFAARQLAAPRGAPMWWSEGQPAFATPEPRTAPDRAATASLTAMSPAPSQPASTTAPAPAIESNAMSSASFPSRDAPSAPAAEPLVAAPPIAEPPIAESPAAATPVAEPPAAATPIAEPPVAANASVTPAPPPDVVLTTAEPASAIAAPELSAREAGLLAAMNKEREALGLPALVPNVALTDVARARSRDMIDKNYFAHFYEGGVSAYSLLSAAGVSYSAAGENLAKVAGDEEQSVRAAIEALMRSPSHRDAILDPRYRFVGVGVATDDAMITIFTTIFTDR